MEEPSNHWKRLVPSVSMFLGGFPSGVGEPAEWNR